MSANNACVLLHGPENSSISHTCLPIPSLKDFPSDHVLLEIAYVGVCGSDVHLYMHGGVGSDPKKYAQHYASQAHLQPKSGLVMGHEASARVVEKGPSVTSLQPGDCVAIEPGIPCWKCNRCAEGKYNLCPGMRFAASFHDEGGLIKQTPGALSQFYVLPDSLCYKLPESVNLAQGVLVEPLAVGVHACRMAKVSCQPGAGSVMVIGAGTIGVIAAAVACAFGAKRVILVDVVGEKLELARSWLTRDGGAGQRGGVEIQVYVSQKDKSAKENAEEALKVGGSWVDAVIEASGVPSATAMGVYALRSGGNMVQTGLAKQATMDGFPIVELSEKEIHLHGAFRYGHGDFEIARDLLARGLIGRLEELISNVFEFAQYEDAWKATRDGVGKGVKNLIRVGGQN